MSKDEAKEVSLIFERKENYIQLGEAKIFMDEVKKGKLDEQTFKQIQVMAVNPGVSHVRVMPDCHASTSCVVGFTAQITDKVVPAWIGSDIGCGILTYPLGRLDGGDLKAKEFKRMDDGIRKLVPMGLNGSFTNHPQAVVTPQEIEVMCGHAKSHACAFLEAYKVKNPNPGFELPSVPDYSTVWFRAKCKRLGMNFDLALRGIGSLGHSNHFVEINHSQNGVYYLTIHCGSRALGSKICLLHQGKIVKQQAFNWVLYNKEERRLKKLHKKDKDEYTKQLALMKIKLEEAEKNPANFLTGSLAFDYFYDFIFALEYAKLNRRVILRLILSLLNLPLDESQIIESVHNYIDLRDFILRKGAISAHKDETCIVSLNMRDGILLCRGKGEDDWNQSCAHGAGRVSSRSTAMDELKMNQFEADMSGIYSSSVVRACLDEAPKAYKDSGLIMGIITQTVDIIEQLRPVLNIKATS